MPGTKARFSGIRRAGSRDLLEIPLRDSELFARDPIAYYERYIHPAYEKQGLTQEQITRENALLFGSTGGNLFSIVERQSGAIHRSADSWRKALGIDASVDVAKGTVDGKLVDLTAQWATLMKNIGNELLPSVNKGLGYLVDLLKFINDNFDRIKSAVSNIAPSVGRGLFPGISAAMGIGGALHAGAPPTAGGTTVPITVNMHLDGQVVAQSTIKHFLGGLDSSPSTGTRPIYGSRRPIPGSITDGRPLTLGPVTFADFEIPREVPFGGAQSLVVKKLVGGDRVIDAMGRDDRDIGWSGRFRGSLAEVRARQLDLMRIQGQQQLLSWSSLRFLVLVERFEADFSTAVRDTLFDFLRGHAGPVSPYSAGAARRRCNDFRRSKWRRGSREQKSTSPR